MGNTVDAVNAIAVGNSITASGANVVAIGNAAQATQVDAIAVGRNAEASGIGGIAIGSANVAARARATGADSLAIAANSQATNTGAMAIGLNSAASGFNSVAFGIGASATQTNAVAIGQGSSATAANAVALGNGSVANVANTVSVGSVGNERRIVNVAAGNLVANGTDAVNAGQLFETNTNLANLQTQINGGTIGLVQQAGAGQPITVGAATDGTVVNFNGTAGTRQLTGLSAGTLSAVSTDAVTGAQLFTANQRVAAAFGTVLDANNQIAAPSYTIQGTAYADVASAFAALDAAITGLTPGTPFVAVNSAGTPASATGANAIAIGQSAQATQAGAVAIGVASQATGANAIAIGNGAVATGSVAVGAAAVASNGGAAFGDNATATGTNSTAVGPGARATHANSAAIGNGATTTRANQQVYGTAAHTHTMPGITSAASRAAQSGPTQVVTSDSAGNLATASLSSLGFATQSDIAAINSRLDRVAGQADKALTGVAMAFAMAGVPTLLPHEKLAATINVGTYQGSHGFAINAAWRVAAHVQVNGGIGYGPDQNIVGGRAGLRIGW